MGKFGAIASLDVIDTKKFNGQLMYVPESDAFSVNFMRAGYDSALLVPNLGTLFYFILA